MAEFNFVALDLEFSPNGHYISLWERYVKGSESEPNKNVSIYSIKTQSLITTYSQKNQSGGWNVQWSENEDYFGRLVSGEVQFFETAHMEQGL